MRYIYTVCTASVLIMHSLSGCSGQDNSNPQNSQDNEKQTSSSMSTRQSAKNFKEGVDYQIYERIRMLDKVGFTEPQEAYSVLLPKGWRHQDAIIWNTPGSSCAGTFSKLNAASPDAKYSLEIYPDLVYTWATNADLMQFYRSNPPSSPNCAIHEPVRAEDYLRNVFVKEIGDPQVISITQNQGVVDQMKESNEASMRELRQYGAGQMRFDQTAINAEVKWNDGSLGLVVLGVTILDGEVPNAYNGTSDRIYTTQVSKRTVFKYPEGENEQAKNQFSVIMSSVRTNPAWKEAVSKFWVEARQQSHVAHVGRIKMMDEQTRRIGERAIQNGQERLRNMDTEMRNWEQRQNSQDYMHTEFIKTIRGVENYRDETGKYEMSAGYDHVWSRSDGNSFILSNNSTFDPSSVFQDQNWKEMKKVH